MALDRKGITLFLDRSEALRKMASTLHARAFAQSYSKCAIHRQKFGVPHTQHNVRLRALTMLLPQKRRTL